MITEDETNSGKPHIVMPIFETVQYEIYLTELTSFNTKWKHEIGTTVGQNLLLFTNFPYRVSCSDQQGQMHTLITAAAVENESKMRPITMQA